MNGNIPLFITNFIIQPLNNVSYITFAYYIMDSCFKDATQDNISFYNKFY